MTVLLGWLARLWVVLSWLIMVAVAALVMLALWVVLRPLLVPERRRGCAPVARVTPYQQDLGDEDEHPDAVQEGLGCIHPQGHHVTPLEGLTRSERALWDEVRRNVGHQL